ncbi:hypothetical protein SBDP1_1530009 [Syntrophobacter sp. SbD1]|nr:hypothetical protein SBDP1_1530009 [Syntrophobacter sp. SbD1]
MAQRTMRLKLMHLFKVITLKLYGNMPNRK